MSVVRENLLKDKTYAPYCMSCNKMPRMIWKGKQFQCPHCHCWTEFPEDFISKVIEFRNS